VDLRARGSLDRLRDLARPKGEGVCDQDPACYRREGLLSERSVTSLSTSERRRRREGFSSSDDLSAAPEPVTPGVMSDRSGL